MNSNKLLAEFLGTLVLLFVIIYSQNAWFIGLALTVMILVFGKLSGGNFNPAVTIMMVLGNKQPKSELIPYLLAQLLGALTALQIYKFSK